MISRKYRRFWVPPVQSFFLLGPRGTGKTTVLREVWGDATWIDLLDEALYLRLLAEVGIFHERLSALPPGSRVVVDEIQRLPGLLNEVHRLIESKGLIFALSGSSARKLRRGGVNLLAGRALLRHLHPFIPAELGADFNLERALSTGTFPIVWDSPQPEETLAAYVQTYLREEIQAEALVRNLSGFARFLPVAALCHGQVLNTSSIARDAAVARTTVDGFFQILEDTLLGFRLPAHLPGLRVREKKKPKFYLIDPGLVRGIKRQRGTVAPEERGHLFEGFIAQLLRAHDDYQGLYDSLAYWSPAEAKQTEVDFVLTRGREVIAIEAKSAPRVSSRDLAGLRAIGEDPAVRRRILVYTGPDLRTRDGIEIWPFDHFADTLAAGEL